jgi:EipB-like
MQIIRVSQARRFAILAGAAMAVLAAMRLPSAADDLVAHHATYALSLAPGNGNSSITGADGIMVYDMKDTCDGWATDLKLKMIISFDNGDARTFETSQVSWEAKSGKSFRFLTKSGSGGGDGSDGQSNQTRGEARIDSSGQGSVVADLPVQAEGKLPGGTLFPIGQTDLVLKQAAAGETFVGAEVFDGTIPTQAVQETALIGAGEKDWNGMGKKFPDLAGLTSYPVGLAYFIGDSTDATPDNEQSERLYTNGIIGLFDFDFGQGGIKIRALLNDLKLQPAPGC